MTKALIVSPYLDHLGGGERYMLTVAQVVESLGYELYLSWDNLEEIQKLSAMLGIKLSSPKLDPIVKNLYFAGNPLRMYRATKQYDLVIYLSDGSIPLLGGKRNIVHMQVPFHNVQGRSWKNQIKKLFIHDVIVNSEFTKRIVDSEYGINSVVIYPPVPQIQVSAPKENIILSVGRFEPSLNTKKQDVLIDAWRVLSPRLPGWKLVLAGASSSESWTNELKTRAGNLPVDFMVNVSHDDLSMLYAKAKIYWHAAGYGVDETKNPELTEHFGISTVEAVSASSIPLVVPFGGQKEIIKNPNLTWTTIDELAEKTLLVINSLPSTNYLSDLQIDRYTEASFAKNLQELIHEK